MNQVLFICTGNYYRSRYAEILFNHTANQYGLAWSSFSRGFQESTREAPISPHTLNRLDHKGMLPTQVRFPIQLSAADMTMAHRIILMDEQEHKPMLLSEYPEWSSYVDYWNIQDVDFEQPLTALERLERKIDLLIGSLETENNQFLWQNNHLEVKFN